MNEIINYGIENKNGILVVDSRILAKYLGVNHKDLLEKIDGYVNKFSSAELSAQFYMSSTYISVNGRTVRNYLITEKGVSQLLGGYNSSVAIAFDLNVAYINEFDRMKQYINNINEESKLLLDIINAKDNMSRAIALNIYNQKIVEPLKLENKEMKHKANYYDFVLQSPNLVTVKAMASDYGKSAQWLNKYLNEKGIQYKQGGTWYLYTKYSELGYAKLVTTAIDEEHTREHLKWTHKGRLFVYNVLKEDNILPLLEREENN